MDNFHKLCQTIDTLFGIGVSKRLPKDIDIVISRKTGRIRNVTRNGILLLTPRKDGGLAITRYCAEVFLKNNYAGLILVRANIENLMLFYYYIRKIDD